MATPFEMSTGILTKGLYDLPSLREDQIRLLRVESDDTNDIRCTVTIHALCDETRFAALSYTWGPCHQEQCNLERGVTAPETTKTRCTISCNDHRVEVTENLHDFLHYWKHSQDRKASDYIWIDALCIDQESSPERSYQVKIMGQIYIAASQVLVWLGPEDNTTSLAFDHMARLNSLRAEEKSALSSHQVAAHNTNPLLDLASWKALAQFFSRTWFSRAWIIQEVVLSRDCVVVCGEHVMSWEVLVNVSIFLATSSWTNFLKDRGSFRDDSSVWHNTPARLAAARKTWKGSYNEGLLYALIRARSSVCQNPRDKVYSQLHLGQASLLPDYERSTPEVYILAAEYILKHSGSLLLLACIEGEAFQNPAYKLPSWVPDWSVTKCIGLRMTGYRHFNAAGKRPSACSLSDDKRILDIEAIKLDDIVKICERKKDLRSNLHSSTLWQLISELGMSYVTTHGTQSREEVVWRTLMTNRGSLQTERKVHYPAPKELEHSFRDWILWRYAVAPEVPTLFPLRTNKDSILPSQHELEDTREKAANDPRYLANLAYQASIYDLHYSHAMLQRPYLTKQGYFGIGTQCLREGDSVWIVAGCRVPLILRPVDGSRRYRLVGGSYLHGFMDGEALSRKDVTFKTVSLE